MSSKTLVAFYSRAGENYFGGQIRDIQTGNTKVVAEILHGIVGGDLCEITSKEYPNNYNQCTEMAKRDLKEKPRPEIKLLINGKLSTDFSINNYDTIYLGYPCWWELHQCLYSHFLSMKFFHFLGIR